MNKHYDYDPDYALSYGYYRCTACRNEFYGGGSAIHADGCTEQGYASCVYVVGPPGGVARERDDA